MPTTTTYDDLLARVRDLIVTSEDRIPVVAITGHGGSGKSTLAERLGADLGLEPDQVVSTDAFYAATCGPDAGMWEQHDWSLIEALVESMKRVPPPGRLRFDYRWWGGVDRPRPVGHQVDPGGPRLRAAGAATRPRRPRVHRGALTRSRNAR